MLRAMSENLPVLLPLLTAWDELDQRVIDTAVRQCRTCLRACAKAKADILNTNWAITVAYNSIIYHTFLQILLNFFINFLPICLKAIYNKDQGCPVIMPQRVHVMITRLWLAVTVKQKKNKQLQKNLCTQSARFEDRWLQRKTRKICRPRDDILCGRPPSYTLHCTTVTLTFDMNWKLLSRAKFTSILVCLHLFFFESGDNRGGQTEGRTDRQRDTSRIVAC